MSAPFTVRFGVYYDAASAPLSTLPPRFIAAKGD